MKFLKQLLVVAFIGVYVSVNTHAGYFAGSGASSGGATAAGASGAIQMSNGSGGLSASTVAAENNGLQILNNNDIYTNESYMGIGVNNSGTYTPRIWMGNDNRGNLELIPTAANSVVVREDIEIIVFSTSSVFSVQSTSRGSMPWPVLTTTQMNNITDVSEGLVVYNVTTHKVTVSTAANTTSWVAVH